MAATTAECALPLPVTVSQDDHFTDTTARQILAADRAYEKLCVKGSR